MWPPGRVALMALSRVAVDGQTGVNRLYLRLLVVVYRFPGSEFRVVLGNILNRGNFKTPNLIVFTPPTATNPTGLSDTEGAITSMSTTSRQAQIHAQAALATRRRREIAR